MTKQKKKKSNVLPMIIGLIPGFIAGFTLALLIDWAFGDISTPLYICALLGGFVVLVIALFFGIAAHEVGHLVFGLMTGYKFSSYRIFSFMWLKDKDGKIKLRRFKLAGTGGQCLMAPPDMTDGKIPTTIYNLGGIFTNLIFGAIFLILFFVFFNIRILALAMMMFCMINLAFVFTNGIPMSSGGIDNDAKNTISIRKDPKAMRAFWIQMKINEEVSKGVYLRDMPKEWFELPSHEEMQNSIISAVAVFAANRLMDEKKFEKSDVLMAQIIDGDNATIDFYKQMLTCDRMYVELIGECRSEVIENMLNTNQKAIMKAMKDYPAVIRTEYAYELLLKQDLAKANKILENFEKIAKKYPYENEIKAERELIEIAMKKYQEKINKNQKKT